MGFDGRVYLLGSEYETYQRRMPVRYLRHPLDPVCSVCGKVGTSSNPLQRAHKIPFNLGIKKYRLTPDYLDRIENIVTAHRGICNKSVELSHEDIVALLKQESPL